MSGAGRKHRAKHLTRQYLDVSGWVGPKEGETLAICLESPHGQHVRVLLLFARPQDVPNLAKVELDAERKAAVTPSPGGDSGASTSSVPQEGEMTLLEREQLAFLPGKFHKVIWLSIKDVVVVSDGTVVFKPSPEQIENFLRDPSHSEWRERIAAAQQKAEDQRVAIQRMPQYGASAQTTTSVLTGPQVHRGTHKNGELGDGDDEDVTDLVNPNWRNIKHHQQYFYGADDDDSDEEKDEEADEEEEVEDEQKM